MPYITGKSLYFSLNVTKSLGFFEKPHFKKTSISLKMYLKILAILKKPSS
jgi:hypothetical protein